MNQKLFDLIGLLGACIVMISNIPQLILFHRNKHAKGISVFGNWIAFFGVALRTIYLYHSTSGDMMSILPYFFSLTCIIYTKYWIYFPKD